jgi:hypothetical protein
MKIKKSAAPAALKPTNIVPATRSTPVTSVTPTPPAKPATAANPAPPASGVLTTIDVKMDVGFGNAIYLRGEGSGLTWERGKALVCVDGGTWRWSQTVSAPITFKVLLNDKVWSAGKDLVIKPGQKIEVAPSFA